MRVVVAVGLKALLRPGERRTPLSAAVAEAAEALAEVAAGNELVVTHGCCQGAPGTSPAPGEGIVSDPTEEGPDEGVGDVIGRLVGQALADRLPSRRITSLPPGADAVTIARLSGSGVIVVVAGPGGSAIDDDLAASQLATRLDAGGLVLATDVPAVVIDWGRASSREIRQTTPEHLRGWHLAAGSMGSKVEAACRFVDHGGGWAAIGSLHDLAALVAGDAGTRVAVGPGPIRYHARPRPAIADGRDHTRAMRS